MPDMPTLWVPYVWVISAVILLAGVVVAVLWGFRHGQFDEKIKYQMFDELDDDMYLDEAEQELAMRQKRMARESRLRKEAEEEAAETAAAASGKPGASGKSDKGEGPGGT
jgi:nitrogen fixation-related uncharacterized protein